MKDKNENKKSEFDKYLDSHSVRKMTDDDLDSEVSQILSKSEFKKKFSERGLGSPSFFQGIFYNRFFRFSFGFAVIILLSVGIYYFFYLDDTFSNDIKVHYVKNLNEPVPLESYEQTETADPETDQKEKTIILAYVDIKKQDRGEDDQDIDYPIIARNSIELASDYFTEKEISVVSKSEYKLSTDWYKSGSAVDEKQKLIITADTNSYRVNIIMKSKLSDEEEKIFDLRSIVPDLKAQIEEYASLAN